MTTSIVPAGLAARAQSDPRGGPTAQLRRCEPRIVGSFDEALSGREGAVSR